MMNVLFCHDGPINCDENKRYYSIGFNDKLLERYAAVFGNVGIVTRVDRTSNISPYTESDKLSVDKYRVIEYPNYLTLSGLFANKTNSTKLLESEILQCDALVVRLPSFLGSKCIRIAQKHKKPFLIELVGCPWDALKHHSLSGKLLAPYLYFITKRQVRYATDVLYVTSEFLQRRYPTLGRQIGGCSNVELQSIELQDNDQNIFRANAIDANEKKLIIGTVGKIDLRYKGHATVIEAIRKLNAEGYDIQYQIVGPGDKSNLEKIAMRNQVSDSVIFTGSMDHNKIFEWLDTIDVYIQPSLTEGMARSLIEAMSRGRPCIASNAGGMPELLDKKFIYAKGNADQLANILLNAAQNGLFMQGPRNKEFTKRFAPNVLKERRAAFYRDFQNYTIGRLQE